jgi:GMP synthase (glutamine-hydrolysing)
LPARVDNVAFIESSVREISTASVPHRDKRRQRRGLAVSALLVHKAIGDRPPASLWTTAASKKEFESVLADLGACGEVIGVTRGPVLTRLQGIEDPEQKRKIIGEEFIRVFEEEARKLGNPPFLVQGTLYPDVIESVSVRGPSAVIKSHHNVGGLPLDMDFELVEPLRELFKDEVRKVGEQLGMDPRFVYRHPFPGPGLAVRILGSVTRERLAILREADAILLEEMDRENLTRELWQAFVLLLPIHTVGVMGRRSHL